MTRRVSDRVCPATGVDLLVDVGGVALYSADGQEKFVAYFPIAGAFGDEAQHLKLSWRQATWMGCPSGGA